MIIIIFCVSIIVDECFEQVSERLLKTADAMKKRFHLFQLRSMQVSCYFYLIYFRESKFYLNFYFV